MQAKAAGEKEWPVVGRHEYNGFTWFYKVQIQHWEGREGKMKTKHFPPNSYWYERKGSQETWPFSASLCGLCATLPESWLPTSTPEPDLHINYIGCTWCPDIQLSPQPSSSWAWPGRQKAAQVTKPRKTFPPDTFWPLQNLTALDPCELGQDSSLSVNPSSLICLLLRVISEGERKSHISSSL